MPNDNTIEISTHGAMDRDIQHTGGTGFVITFPSAVGVPDIHETFRRDGQGIHRLEMTAILEALVSLNKWLKTNSENKKAISRVVVPI